MRNGLPVFVRIVWACAVILFSLTGMAQSVPNPTIETPNVATLDKFGSIPVDQVTGTPNISIPIHQLHFGKITVPIALRYHPGALRVSAHESWVGMGWDLQSGGSITRVVRGAPDEYNAAVPVNTSSDGYYPVSSTDGALLVNGSSNWYTPQKLDTFFSGLTQNESMIDVSADEFTFNFMGHTGKFYYEGPTLGWQVASDEKIQVQLNSTPFLNGGSSGGVVGTLISEYPANQLLVNATNVNEEFQSQVLSGFVLTVPDGTKFYFGGINSAGNGIGIEFYTFYNMNGPTFDANSWLLTKIVDVDGNEVDFNYSASYAVADLGIGFYAFTNACQVTTGGWLGQAGSAVTTFTNMTMNLNQYQGMLSLPLYLDNITCNNETITFIRQQANSLRLAANIYTFNPSNTTGYSNEFGIFKGLLGDGQTINGQPIQGINNLQWMELKSINITDGNGAPGPNGAKGIGQGYRQYTFAYNPSTSQRLTLTNLQELDNAGNSIEKYTFGYTNTYNGTNGLMSTGYSGDQSDHWGYFNATTVSAAIPGTPDGTNNGSIFAAKVTNPQAILTGLLTSITYPTGGHVTLTWEAHYYSQVVDNTQSRQALASQTGYAGGCRIKEIQSYLANNTLVHDKKYLYIRGYSPGNPGGTGSSGVLNGNPTYFMTLSSRWGIAHEIQESIQVVSLNSLGVYGYNAEGSYLAYDQVVELNEDNSYIISYFTNYGPDLNNVNHYDVPPIGSVGWLPTDCYFPYSELDLERGKPIGTFKYNASGVLVEKTGYTYRSDAGRFNNPLRLISLNNSYSGCTVTDALLLASAFYRYTYCYYPVSQTVTTYDQHGKNPQTLTTGFQYNANNLVSVRTETDSKGETIVTTYKYPPDMTDATSLAMTAAHILTPVMQTSVTNNGVAVSTTTTNYATFTPAAGVTLYKPQTTQVQIGSNPVETRTSFYSYDAYGNIAELSKTNDIHEVYLWGYFGQYPVAKLSGSNATISQVISTLGSGYQGAINAITNSPSAPSDGNLQHLLGPLRSISGTLVTVYTYLPLSGVTSYTDPRGMITSYQYDNFQRLQLITDNDGNVLKTFNYNYEIPQ